jgi:rod shape-determining protein MreD
MVMDIDFLKRLLGFVLLCMAQVLVFNRIQLFYCAIPMIYVYFVVTFSYQYSKAGILLWCFLMGIIIDMFDNTPGLTATALTALGVLQPYVLSFFIPHDATETLHTTLKSMGWSKYFTYVLIMVSVYSLLFFTVDAFSFFNWLQWLLSVVGSTLLTVLLVLTLESVRK